MEKYQKEGFRSQDHCSLVDRMQIEFLSVKIKFHEIFFLRIVVSLGGKVTVSLLYFIVVGIFAFCHPEKAQPAGKA